jgi:hypothetical protein
LLGERLDLHDLFIAIAVDGLHIDAQAGEGI